MQQEAGEDPSQYASSQIVATSKPRELGSTGPDAGGVNGVASKLANKAAKQAATTTPHSNGTSNGVH